MAENGMSHRNLAMPLGRFGAGWHPGPNESGISRGEDDNYGKAMGRAA